MVVPNLALMAVATVPDVTTQASSRSSSRAPEACPSSVAGWSITGTHIYTGTCSVSGGAITVNAGADITFEAVTLTHTGTYYFYNLGTLRILNSTIQGGTSWYGIYSYSNFPLLKIEKSVIKNYISYGVYANTGKRVDIGNSTIDNNKLGGSYGFYCYNNAAGHITKNKLTNISSSYGMYVYLSSNLWIDNNTLTMTAGTYGTYLNSFMGAYDNNTISGGGTNVLRVYGQTPKSFWYNKASGTAIRLYVQLVTLTTFYCDFRSATGQDITTAASGNIKAYDTQFVTSTVAASTSIQVYWRANMTVKWLSTDQTVQGAHIAVTDAKGLIDPRDFVTDNNGNVNNVYLMEYSKDATSKKVVSPYWFNATANKGGKDYTNYTQGNVTNSTNNVTIILDDVPPPLTILDPKDGLMTNRTTTTINATTERNVSVVYPLRAEVQVDSTVFRPAIGQDGKIQQEIPLSSDGKHLVTVRAIDSALNMKAMTINITRDTINPPITISAPADGTLTNVTTIAVTGNTEPGATLTCEGVVITVQPSGAFNHQYKLAEGDNAIRLRVEDKAHNWVIKTVNVKLDTRPPILGVVQPQDGLKTNQVSLQMQGSTESKATVTVNGNQIALMGTAFMMPMSLQEGENTFVVMSCDAAKNCNVTTIHVFLDTIAPPLDVTAPKDQFLTNVDTVSIQGTTEEGAKVTVMDRTVTFTGTGFSTDYTLREGKNTIKIDAYDGVGNKAERMLTVFLDKTPPSLVITDPKDGAIVSNAELTVEGTTEAGAIVTIDAKTVTNTNGGFAGKVTLKEGLNNITVSAVDKAGNKANAPVKVTLDTKVSLVMGSPTRLTGIETMNTTINITGKVDKDASVYINDIPVIVKKDGTFKQEVPLDLGTNNITVQAEDPLGNKMEYTYQVVRKEKPSPPPPNPIISGGNGLGGLLLPIIIVVAVLAAVGVGAGLYMRGRSKAKAQVPAPQAPPTPPPAPPAAAPVYPQPQAYAQPSAPPPQYAAYPMPPPPPQYMTVQPPLPPPPPPAYTESTPAPPGITSETMVLYNEAQGVLEEAEARGEDVSRRRTHLRVAQTFMNKGNNEKVLYYSKKVLGRQ
jgi:uncharacterized Zn-binding protein involved in type VI secretion